MLSFFSLLFLFFFFFNDTATTEIYTLSLHDALPNWRKAHNVLLPAFSMDAMRRYYPRMLDIARSEEHTSELQSLAYLVCRLLLEKKKIANNRVQYITKKKKLML